MAELFIPVLTFFAVICIGGCVLVIRGARRRALEARLYGEPAGAMVGGMGQGSSLAGALEQVGRAVSSDKPTPNDLRESLAHAGFYDTNAATIYMGAQLLLVVLAIPLGGLIALVLRLSLIIGLCVVFVIVALAGLLPRLYLSLRRSRRRDEVRRQIPDAIDLLEICVSSGMGLDMA